MQFSQAVTRARGKSKARIVRSLLNEKDWRARLEVLARVFPDEYGRRDLAPIPVSPQPELRPSVAFVLRLPDGSQREISSAEAEKLYAEKFEVVESTGIQKPESRAEDYRFDRRLGVVPVECNDSENGFEYSKAIR